MLLEVRNMCILYNGTIAVNDISMKIDEGESVGIIGPNGSGKSTFLKGLAGVLPLNRGTVNLDGEDITALSPRERLGRSLIYIPQGMDVFPSLTVAENLKLFISEIKDSKITLEEAYSFYPLLKKERKRLAGNLSGGERRLLSLTRAFISKPKILLLDEPSAGIAPAMLNVVVEKIKEFIKRGITLILVEQILSIAKSIANNFYLLNNGKTIISFSQMEYNFNKDILTNVFIGKKV